MELQYYLVVPLLIFLTSKYKLALKTIFLGLGVVSCYLYFNPVGLVDVDRSLLSWAIFFIFGFSFYETVVSKQYSNILALSFLMTAVVVIAGNTGKDVKTFYVTMFCIVLSALLLTLQKDYKFGIRDRLAGDLSYPVYIFHIVFLGWTVKLLQLSPVTSFDIIPRFWISFFTHAIVSIGVAYFSLKLISDPIDRIRARIRESRR